MNAKELSADVICSGNPPLWRTTFTVYTDNSHEQAVKIKDEILEALNGYSKLKENFNLLLRNYGEQAHYTQSSGQLAKKLQQENNQLKESSEFRQKNYEVLVDEYAKITAENKELTQKLDACRTMNKMGKNKEEKLQQENEDLTSRIVQRDEENYQLKQLKERLDILIAGSNPIVDVFTVSVLEKLRDGEQNGN